MKWLNPIYALFFSFATIALCTSGCMTLLQASLPDGREWKEKVFESDVDKQAIFDKANQVIASIGKVTFSNQTSFQVQGEGTKHYFEVAVVLLEENGKTVVRIRSRMTTADPDSKPVDVGSGRESNIDLIASELERRGCKLNQMILDR